MAKCICCNAEIDDSKTEYLGVIQRYHYDDRYDTAAIDHGPITYKPVALIQSACVRTARSKRTKTQPSAV